jgi:hypothetical protein
MGIHSIRLANNDRSRAEHARVAALVVEKTTSGLAAHPETWQLRLAQPKMRRELIAELSALEVTPRRQRTRAETCPRRITTVAP